MSSLRTPLSRLLAGLAIFVSLCLPVLAENWMVIGEDDSCTVSIDVDSFQKGSDGNVIFWERAVYTESGRAALREHLIKDAGLSPDAPELYSSLNKIEFSPQRTYRLVLMICQGEGGVVLSELTMTEPHSAIEPGGSYEGIWNYLYKKQ